MICCLQDLLKHLIKSVCVLTNRNIKLSLDFPTLYVDNLMLAMWLDSSRGVLKSHFNHDLFKSQVFFPDLIILRQQSYLERVSVPAGFNRPPGNITLRWLQDQWDDGGPSTCWLTPADTANAAIIKQGWLLYKAVHAWMTPCWSGQC